MTSFVQCPIEMKVGKGNRVLTPLKRDPHVEVSAYRDNQFKVILEKNYQKLKCTFSFGFCRYFNKSKN